MCADCGRAGQLVHKFTRSYRFWHHLHFWVPGATLRVACVRARVAAGEGEGEGGG